MHRLTALSLAALMLGAPASVGSHPHVWVTGGAHFGMDAEGRLERLYINWTYDTYASLYLLSYVKADEDGDQVLNEEDKGGSSRIRRTGPTISRATAICSWRARSIRWASPSTRTLGFFRPVRSR